MRAGLAVLLLLLATPASACLDWDDVCITPVWRTTQFEVGTDLAFPDVAQVGPAHEDALNVTGVNPSGGPWLATFDDVYTDSTTCVEAIESLPGGKQCAGVCARLGGLKAVCAQTCNQKTVGTLELGVLNTVTKAIVALKPNVSVPLDTYGGSIPPANCGGSGAGATSYHAYCQLFVTCLSIVTDDLSITATATMHYRGSGLKNDPSRYSFEASLTLGGSSSWSGLLPVGVPLVGVNGVISTSIEQNRMSFFNYQVSGL